MTSPTLHRAVLLNDEQVDSLPSGAEKQPDLKFIFTKLQHVGGRAALDKSAIVSVLTAEWECVFIDEDLDTLCRIAVEDERLLVRVVWLLPLGRPTNLLVPVFKKAALDVGDRYPGRKDYDFDGWFDTWGQAETWHQYFPDAEVRKYPNGQHRIWMKGGWGDGLEIIEQWR